MKGRLAIVWHLHQPDYRDPETGRPVMPWVRLHALRGYRDLFVETAERGTAWTLNVVPSLLDQVEHYANGGDDAHLAATRTPAADLGPGEVHLLPSGHPTITRAHPAYAELRAKIGAETPSVDEVRDVQVWATLAWFGATALRDFPVLRDLIRQGRGFTENDKTAMLAVQQQVLHELPGQLRRVAGTPGPSISTSPYFHPILPLLVDARHARRAMPDLPDEVVFSYPQDARRQLVSARSRVEELTGRAPIGLWPSEGSVSPEVVAIAAEAGFRWLATDARILARSDRSPATSPGGWDVGHGIRAFFRDTDLSDRIGFRYAQIDPAAAADDLVAEARQRADGGVLLIALDGENPWESFADAGGAFRKALVDRMDREDFTAVTLDRATEGPPVGVVRRLHTGSWIGADLRIWIGHPEDRAAWRALAAVRAAAEEATVEARERAMPHLLAAEGSDWFWWFGEDFDTPWAPTFDALFRGHVAAAWRALGLPVPPELDRPIRGPRMPDRSEPVRFLAVDPSEVADWAGWSGAGEIRPKRGAMAEATAIRRVRFGWGRSGELWVRVEAPGDGWSFDPPPTEVHRVKDGIVGRFRSGEAALTVIGPNGRWPDAPAVLTPPADPALAWWEV